MMPFMRLSPALRRPAGCFVGPRPIVEVPAYGPGKTRFEALAGAPAELAGNLAGVHGVAPVVARPVLDERHQVSVLAALSRKLLLQQFAQGVYEFIVRLLGIAADVVGFAGPSALENQP